nr:retrovirus-related Pol polyprotein from transposon TNT 1-94 [Tanacetum cinerariifolium]
MRPFSCPVTILNTLDPLGKFQGKVDEGFLIGYSVCSKAFRVFNSSTRIVQETLHVNFMENKPNVAGSGPAWLFDIDSLSQTMNYHPVLAENQSNPTAAKEEGTQSYVLFPVLSDGSTNPKNNNKDAHADGKEHDNDIHKSVSPDIYSSRCGDQSREQECINNSSNGGSAAGPSVSAADLNFTNSTNDFSTAGPSNLAMPNLEDLSHDADDVGAEAVTNNMESIISVSPIPTTRIHKDHPISQIIGDLSSTTQTRSMARGVRDQAVVKRSGDVTRLQALVDKNKIEIPEDVIREILRLDDAEGAVCLPNEEIFAGLAQMGYEKPSTKLTFYKAFFSSQWNSSKFYMYPRFVQLIIQAQVVDLSSHTTRYISPALTQKVFANMRRVGKGFSGVETLLFENMLEVRAVDAQEEVQVPAQDVVAHETVIEEVTVEKVHLVVEVVNAAKLMTEVVTAAATQVVAAITPIPASKPAFVAIVAPISAAKPVAKPKVLKVVPAAPAVSTRKRKGVVIRDPEEELHDDTLAETQFDANMRFLLKSREEMEKEQEEIIKSINETPA